MQILNYLIDTCSSASRKRKNYYYSTLKKITTAIVFVTMTVTVANAQNLNIREFAKLDTTLSFHKENVSSSSSPAIASCKNIFTFTNYNPHEGSDTIIIHFIDISTNETKDCAIFEQGIAKKMLENLSSSFDQIGLTENRLVLTFGEHALIYAKTTDGTFRKEKNLQFQIHFSHMKMLNDGVVLLSNTYHSDDTTTVLALYDIETDKVIKAIHPYQNTHLLYYIGAHSLMDYANGTVIWGNSNENSFLLFDTSLRKSDSVFSNDTVWNAIPETYKSEIAKINRHYAINIIETLMGIFDSIDAVIGCHFLDSNHIAIVKLPSADNKLRLNLKYRFPLMDVWSKKDGIWTRVHQDIVCDGDYFSKTDEILTQDNFIDIDFLCPDCVRVVGNKIVSLSKQGFSDNPLGVSFRQRLSQEESFLISNDYFIQINIHSHKLTSEQ